MVCLHYRGFVGWLKYSFPFLSKWLKYSLPFTRVAIFEAKRAMTLGDLESACDKALRQIDQRMYSKDFEDEYDSDHIHCYGIAFYKKRCFVKKKD